MIKRIIFFPIFAQKMKIQDTYKHKGQRNKLIQELSQKGIKDIAVLEAINKIPRHIFFEEALASHAYQDKAFPIGDGQTISQPFTVARQSELLELSPGKKVLEIGTGSGYQCSVLCALGLKVTSIERHKSLHLKAKKHLNLLQLKPKLICGDGTMGLPSFAPFDAIIVTAGAPIVPDNLIDQLSIGGKLVIPVGDENKQTMYQITKVSNTKAVRKDCGSFSFVPLIGKKGW